MARKRFKNATLTMAIAAALTLSCINPVYAASTDFNDNSTISVNTSIIDNVSQGNSNQTNVYKFILDKDGCVTVNFKSPQQGTTGKIWKITLYNSDYTEIDYLYAVGNLTSQSMITEGLASGTYYVTIASYNYNSASSTDFYDLTIEYSQSDYFEKEFNEGFLTANSIDVNKAYSGTTRNGSSSEKDFYSVDLPREDIYEFHFMSSQQGDSSKYWKIEIYNSFYEMIDSLYASGNKTDQFISQKLASGKYYINVQSYNYSSAKSTDIYQILVSGRSNQDINDNSEEENVKDETERPEETVTEGGGTDFEPIPYVSFDEEDDKDDETSESVNVDEDDNDDGIGETANADEDDNDDGIGETANVDETYDYTISEENSDDDVYAEDIVEILSIHLDKQTVNLETDEQELLEVITDPENIDTDDLVWESSDEDIVDVDDDGVITAIAPGKAVVTVKTEDGRLSASCIVSVRPASIYLNEVKSGRRSIKIVWDKSREDITGYQIQYSTNKGFTNEKKIFVKGRNETSKTISKLGKKKKYYIRLRVYTKKGGKIYFSSWSNTKSARTR